jgi:hypothetical protein
VGTGKDGQDILTFGVLPLWIGHSQMAEQRPLLTQGAVEKEGQVAGERLALDLGNEQAKAVLVDEVEESLSVGLLKGCRNVHGRLLCLAVLGSHGDRLTIQAGDTRRNGKVRRERHFSEPISRSCVVPLSPFLPPERRWIMVQRHFHDRPFFRDDEQTAQGLSLRTAGQTRLADRPRRQGTRGESRQK